MPGQDPCTQLEANGGIWKFDADRTGQLQSDGSRYATGIRSVVALDWNHADSTLYVLQHGRDHFSRMWPQTYKRYDSALLHSEEFMRVTEGCDFGWHYFYCDLTPDLIVHYT